MSRSPKNYDEQLVACGLRVRFVREFLGLTRKEFAKELGVSVNAVQNWESGYQRIGISSVMILLRDKKISADFILDGFINGLDQNTKTAWIEYQRNLSKSA